MSALLGRAPRTANRYDGDEIVQIPLDSIGPGDRLLVRAGEAVSDRWRCIKRNGGAR
jgi:cation transport ATPase